MPPQGEFACTYLARRRELDYGRLSSCSC